MSGRSIEEGDFIPMQSVPSSHMKLHSILTFCVYLNGGKKGGGGRHLIYQIFNLFYSSLQLLHLHQQIWKQVLLKFQIFSNIVS